MDLNELWLQHKTFVIQVGIGLIVWLIGLGLIDGMRGESQALEQQKLTLTMHIAKLRQSLAGAEGQAKGIEALLDGEAESRVCRPLECPPRESYVPAAGDPDAPKRLYSERYDDYRRLHAEAEEHLGLSGSIPFSEGQSDNHRITEELLKMDIAARLLGALRSLRIERLLSMPKPELVSVPIPGRGEKIQEVVVRELRFVAGSQGKLLDFLAAIQRHDRGLFEAPGGVAPFFEVRRVTIARDGDDVEVTLTLVALDAFVTMSEGEKQSATGGAAGRPAVPRIPRYRR